MKEFKTNYVFFKDQISCIGLPPDPKKVFNKNEIKTLNYLSRYLANFGRRKRLKEKFSDRESILPSFHFSGFPIFAIKLESL